MICPNTLRLPRPHAVSPSVYEIEDLLPGEMVASQGWTIDLHAHYWPSAFYKRLRTLQNKWFESFCIDFDEIAGEWIQFIQCKGHLTRGFIGFHLSSAQILIMRIGQDFALPHPLARHPSGSMNINGSQTIVT
jgi:hypothetical protein